jgi:hypothetical protein
MSNTLLAGAIVVIGTTVIWWGMTRPSAEPGTDAWSDGGSESDGCDGGDE